MEDISTDLDDDRISVFFRPFVNSLGEFNLIINRIDASTDPVNILAGTLSVRTQRNYQFYDR